MNKRRRARLTDAVKHLDAAAEIISNVADEEQDSMDNMPENLQGSERYEASEEAVDNLNDALDGISDVKESVNSAITG